MLASTCSERGQKVVGGKTIVFEGNERGEKEAHTKPQITLKAPLRRGDKRGSV